MPSLAPCWPGRAGRALAGCAALLAGLAGCGALERLNGVGHVLHSGDAGVVAAAIKGDEVVLARAGARFRVRLLGAWSPWPVTTPTPLAAADGHARAAWEALGARPVRAFFEAPSRDAHGRVLAYLQVPGQDLGLQQIADGLLLTYTEFPFGRERAYLAAEARARAAGRGIWAQPEHARLFADLRRQWRGLRTARGATTVADPLL